MLPPKGRVAAEGRAGGGCRNEKDVMLRGAYRRMRYGEPIVVVSGLPRSGTSMAMRMLAAGGVPILSDGVRAADEDNPAGYFELEKVKNLGQDHDLSWLRAARGKAVKIISWLLDKLPDEHNYQVLFMHRDLHEVLASQAKMLERRGEMSETEDARMMSGFEQHLVRVRSLLHARACFEVCEIEYTGVLGNPRTEAKRIAGFLGRSLDVEAMAGAVDPSLYRNRG
jgi:hypothetical protein